ncbi:nuclear transport factor 2 family protein [Spiroplasma monobiae]|uniref:Limonene-1,2-epoxide hydrolase n=1 Tax=Spiroplasma monobiae MQ-1 TaxID=1336748 RepID=A0A2K9LTA8_SPISQ|nr:nuclear transport factor 2 family protein [Spiroplasma monobiae]AUM62312.1 limonene-1,2-epoxide hydrolase [Spiroplasma monobiae MQ-1]
MQDKKVINDFYEAFKAGDANKMVGLYSPKATFKDPMFGDLNYEEAKFMWIMLVSTRATSQFELNYTVEEHKGKIVVIWKATYLFGDKKRKVINIVTSKMETEDGLITKHVDSFNFKRWAKQAIGFSGLLFGNAKWFRKKVSDGAKEKLYKFMDYMKSQQAGK